MSHPRRAQPVCPSPLLERNSPLQGSRARFLKNPFSSTRRFFPKISTVFGVLVIHQNTNVRNLTQEAGISIKLSNGPEENMHSMHSKSNLIQGFQSLCFFDTFRIP